MSQTAYTRARFCRSHGQGRGIRRLAQVEMRGSPKGLALAGTSNVDLLGRPQDPRRLCLTSLADILYSWHCGQSQGPTAGPLPVQVRLPLSMAPTAAMLGPPTLLETPTPRKHPPHRPRESARTLLEVIEEENLGIEACRAMSAREPALARARSRSPCRRRPLPKASPTDRPL